MNKKKKKKKKKKGEFSKFDFIDLTSLPDQMGLVHWLFQAIIKSENKSIIHDCWWPVKRKKNVLIYRMRCTFLTSNLNAFNNGEKEW